MAAFRVPSITMGSMCSACHNATCVRQISNLLNTKTKCFVGLSKPFTKYSKSSSKQLLYPAFSETSNNRDVGFWSTSKVTEWSRAVSEAEKIVGYTTSFLNLRCWLSDEVSNIAMHMTKLVGTKHPLLKTARKFIYDGKQTLQTRGLLVLLISKAAGPCSNDHVEEMVSGIYPRQRQLAEITEMINTADLIHKGMVNMDSIQPSDGSPSDMEFGNKMTVLSGDFLLANASVGLAELENTYVVEMISAAIGDLMRAEFTHLRDRNGNPVMPPEGASIEDWKQQTYLSSGSLLAKSCQAAVLLAGHGDMLQKAAHSFGCHVAYAHQLHEELQPLLKPLEDTGNVHVTSAPVLLHIANNRNDHTVRQLLSTGSLDTSKILKMLKGSSAVEEAKQLCKLHGQRALDALKPFSQSQAKTALENIVNAVTAVS